MVYEHQVFVSYATVDDRPAKNGWVSAFVRSLNESMSAAFGFRDPKRIWWDRSSVDEEAKLTEQIRSKVEKSACMVVVLSRGYCKSDWCRQELAAFMNASKGQPDADRRLFLIDLGNVELSDRPKEFHDKRGRHFFYQPPNTTDFKDRETLGFPVPDPENREHKRFFAQVDQLAKDIYERVNNLPGSSETATTPVTINKPYGDVTVFVAEAADDVADEREDVVRFLSDHFRVVPSVDEPLPSRWIDWKTSIDTELKSTKLFVQVLGSLPGRKIAGSEQRLVTAQYEQALSTGLKTISWRKGLPDSVADTSLRNLVATAEYAGTLTDFMLEVRKMATPSPPPKVVERPVGISNELMPMVFIQADVADQSQADRLSDLLIALDCFVSTPMLAGTPQKIREDLEANLSECDGLILFYGQTESDWIRSQFRTLPRMLSVRQRLQPPRPLKALAVCMGDPPNKPDPGVKAKGLAWIDLSLDVHRDELANWVMSMRTGGPQ